MKNKPTQKDPTKRNKFRRMTKGKTSPGKLKALRVKMMQRTLRNLNKPK